MAQQKLRVVVVEDDSLVQAGLKGLLAEQESQFFPTLDDFLKSPFCAQTWDVILLDLCHPTDLEGTRTVSRIPELRARQREAEVIVESGVSNVEVMRLCIQNGASRFISKEYLSEEIPVLLERHFEFKNQREALKKILVGNSDLMKRLRNELVALRFETHVDVLVQGETGTGKELCANAIHSGGPFVAVNVSAVPSELFEAEFFGAEKGAFTGATQSRMGHFEAAGNGTLFLDEIQSLSPAHQAKFLRVLETRSFSRVGSNQERQFRARVVSAANINLREAVGRTEFREDLYYRLAPISLHVPPLRLRGDDVRELTKTFLNEFDTAKKFRVTEAAFAVLLTEYDWPGNVRELRGLIRNLVLKARMPVLDAPEILTALGLGKNQEAVMGASATDTTDTDIYAINWDLSFDENVQQLERKLLELTLARHNSGDARERLKLARSRFYEKIKQYNLQK